MHNKRYRGFTLVELLVVIAIIGILSSIVMVSLGNAKAKSRDSRRVADIKSIQLALAVYYNDNLTYPTNLTSLVPSYLPALPKDPNISSACGTTGNESSCYRYYGYRSGSGACNASNPAVTYYLGAKLEDLGNQALIDDVDSDFTGYAACNNGSDSNGFVGNSTNCSATAGTPQPGGTEACYSQKP